MNEAELAAAIRQSLARIYNLSDDELVARDRRVNALFHALASEPSLTTDGARALAHLTHLMLGGPAPSE